MDRIFIFKILTARFRCLITTVIDMCMYASVGPEGLVPDVRNRAAAISTIIDESRTNIIDRNLIFKIRTARFRCLITPVIDMCVYASVGPEGLVPDVRDRAAAFSTCKPFYLFFI